MKPPTANVVTDTDCLHVPPDDGVAPTTRRKRRGLALLTALLVLVFVSVMTVGVFSFAFANYREGRGLISQERSLAAAEYGQFDVLRTWDTTYTNLVTGATALRVIAVPGGGVDTVRVTKLNGSTYWVASTGSTGSSLGLGSRRRTGLVVRAASATFTPIAAFTSGKTKRIQQQGASIVSGIDANPTGWACPATGGAVAGVAMGDTLREGWKNASSKTSYGSPLVLQTPVADDSLTYQKFGGISYNELTAKANIVYAGGAKAALIAPTRLAGVCNKNSSSNWGEPWRAPKTGVVDGCQGYFPIIWAKGNFEFQDGRGQGIILVDGDFDGGGSFGAEFHGLIIVKGAANTAGSGLKLLGALLSDGNPFVNSTISGNSLIQLSRCALNTVFSGLGLGGSGGASPLKQRSWGDLY